MIQRSGAAPVRSTGISTAIVVGGGLAGLAAAIRLAENGVRVQVFETRPKLGGRATSFDDARTGSRIDNCQHVALGCCTNYRAFLQRVGIEHLLRWYSTTHWLEPGGRHSATGPGPLPAPLHGAFSLLAAKFLPLRDRLAIGHAMLLALREDRAQLPPAPFREWLDRAEQSEAARQRFWQPLIISACNLPIDRVDQAVALHVVQEGLLASRWSSAVGVPAVPLTDLYAPVQRRIEACAGSVRVGESVKRVAADRIETRDGTTHRADRVICAVPFERVASLLDESELREDAALKGLAQLEHSPILGVHLTFDRPVLRLAQAVLIDQGTQWLFRKDAEGRVLHAVISAAEDWMAMDEPAIVARVLNDIRTCIPDAAEAEPIAVRAVKERRATFAPTPASRALRPGTVTRSGVLLAGCYVDTGWPSTMEGAVRSGEMAAAVAMGWPPQQFLQPPLKAGRMVRLLSAS